MKNETRTIKSQSETIYIKKLKQLRAINKWSLFVFFKQALVPYEQYLKHKAVPHISKGRKHGVVVIRPLVLANGRLGPMFVDSFVQLSACIADVTSLALVTMEMVEDFLFVYKGRFSYPLVLSKLFYYYYFFYIASLCDFIVSISFFILLAYFFPRVF